MTIINGVLVTEVVFTDPSENPPSKVAYIDADWDAIKIVDFENSSVQVSLQDIPGLIKALELFIDKPDTEKKSYNAEILNNV